MWSIYVWYLVLAVVEVVALTMMHVVMLRQCVEIKGSECNNVTFSTKYNQIKWDKHTNKIVVS